MSLKHSEERLRATYVELVKKNSQLEEKLLEQDGRNEEQKQKFENSIMKLTNKLIQQRKRSEELEQANARAVRDCRWVLDSRRESLQTLLELDHRARLFLDFICQFSTLPLLIIFELKCNLQLYVLVDHN